MPSDKDLKLTVEQEAHKLSAAMSAVEHWYRETIRQEGQRYAAQEKQIQQKYQQDLQSSYSAYIKSVESSKAELARVEHELGITGLPWSAPAWEQANLLESIQNKQNFRFTRFGSYHLNGPYSDVTTPAILPIIGHKNVLIKAAGQSKQTALNVMQSIMLRLLATLPPGKLQFTLIDPVGLGSNVAGFVKKLPEELTGANAWYESQHIEQRLIDLSSHMATVIQKYLGNQYPTIEDYNEEAGEVREPYRFLIVANFPVNFTEEAAKRLVSIATNGPRTGVYVLITVDTEQPMPHGFNLPDLERHANLIEYQNNRFVWRERAYQDWSLSLDDVPPTKIFDRIITVVGQAALEANKVEVSFDKIVSPENDWWSKNTDTNLEAPIGQRGAKDLQIFSLGRGTAIHALVAGTTGSGKSNLLHTLITSLALTYSPEELELYLIDFKKGVEFEIYASQKLAHAKVVAIQSEREFGYSVLEALDTELQRRGDLLRNRGYSDLKEYREKDKSGEKLPRILLLVDEFQEFFSQDDTLAHNISLILDRLVRQGRAFGIHIILGSQSLAGTYSIARSTTDQMAVRIALRCTEEDSRRILSEDNPAARLLNRPGEAIYNEKNGLVEGNNLFQVVLLKDEIHETYLRKIQEKVQTLYPERTFPQIVFEGNSPAELEANHQLSELRRQQQWPPRPRGIQAWLGEPIAIRPHVAGSFRRQQRSNLLVLGQNEELATAMLFSSVLSISLQLAPQDVQFYIVDLGSADARWEGKSQAFSEYLPHKIHIIKRRKIPEAVQALADLVAEREALADEDDKASFGAANFLVIIGLHRARDLRVDDNYYPAFGEEVKVSTGEQFCEVLRNGPDFNVHTLIWCDTYASFSRIIPRQYADEFDLRVALQMTPDDSMSFLDNPVASKLGPNRALFVDEEQMGRLEKFRPYKMVSEIAIKEIGQQLRQRKGGN